MKKLLIILSGLFLFGCAAMTQPPEIYHEGDPKCYYHEHIKEWQERLNKEGWNEDLIETIFNDCIHMSAYRSDSVLSQEDVKGVIFVSPEGKDYFYTPLEMIENYFNGDCEDIAILMWGSMKILGYPYGCRVHIVRIPPSMDHAIVRLETPGGEWKFYQSVPGLSSFDAPFYISMAEFDDENIWVFWPFNEPDYYNVKANSGLEYFYCGAIKDWQKRYKEEGGIVWQADLN